MVKRRSFKLVLLAILVLIALSAFYNQVVLPSHQALSKPSVKGKVVALTFDDGPMPVYTGQILDILDKYHAKATFFMIGNRMEQYPGIVKEVASRGMVIGNHTLTHPRDLRTLNDQQIGREIKTCSNLSDQLTGQRHYLFRPPRGMLNNRVIRDIRAQGYTIIMWSVCGDNRAAGTPELMARRVTQQIKPGQIILLHDGRVPGRKRDVEATRLILADLSRKGYHFVTVPELLEMQAENNGLDESKPVYRCILPGNI